jgi:hypothetical protein
MNLAPIVVIAYNRPTHFQTVIDALRKNPEASRSRLYVYCDGAQSDVDVDNVAAVRKTALELTGFSHIEIVERTVNLGLSRSIVDGVSQVCDRHGSAIVLEDDVVPCRYFLGYTNAALKKYEREQRVLSVGCFTYDCGFDLPDTFFLNIPDCWGWAVWQRSWNEFDPDGASLLARIEALQLERKFDLEGTYPYTKMLKDQVAGANQSWAVRWYAHALLTKRLVLYPGRSVTRNIGFDGSGTHTSVASMHPPIRIAERQIIVQDVALEESELGRENWKVAARKMRVGPIKRVIRGVARRMGVLRDALGGMQNRR